MANRMPRFWPTLPLSLKPMLARTMAPLYPGGQDSSGEQLICKGCAVVSQPDIGTSVQQLVMMRCSDCCSTMVLEAKQG